MTHIVLAVSYRAEQMEKELKCEEKRVCYGYFLAVLYISISEKGFYIKIESSLTDGFK